MGDMYALRDQFRVVPQLAIRLVSQLVQGLRVFQDGVMALSASSRGFFFALAMLRETEDLLTPRSPAIWGMFLPERYSSSSSLWRGVSRSRPWTAAAVRARRILFAVK